MLDSLLQEKWPHDYRIAVIIYFFAVTLNCILVLASWSKMKYSSSQSLGYFKLFCQVWIARRSTQGQNSSSWLLILLETHLHKSVLTRAPLCSPVLPCSLLGNFVWGLTVQYDMLCNLCNFMILALPLLKFLRTTVIICESRLLFCYNSSCLSTLIDLLWASSMSEAWSSLFRNYYEKLTVIEQKWIKGEMDFVSGIVLYLIKFLLIHQKSMVDLGCWNHLLKLYTGLS